MHDLYYEDKSLKLEGSKQKISNYFSQPTNRNIQLQIKTYLNLRTYQKHRKNEEVKTEVNSLYEKFVGSADNLLDIFPQEFTNAFSCNYMERIFELVIAGFLSNKIGNLKIREIKESLPDLELIHNEKKYFVECTTRATSFMDRYAELLPDFDKYFKIAKLFYEKNKTLKIPEWYFGPVIEQIWSHFTTEEQIEIKKIFGSIETNEHNFYPTKFKEWIFYNRYALLYFRDLISNNIVNALKTISLPESLGESKEHIEATKNHIIKCIAQEILSKLTKKYFSQGTPIVLALSMAQMPQLIHPRIFFHNELLKEKLQNYLSAAVIKEEKYRKNIENLYAILIDTTWYNWFPKIAQRSYGVKFPDGYENYYGIIYNTKCDNPDKIFNKVISSAYTADIDLSL